METSRLECCSLPNHSRFKTCKQIKPRNNLRRNPYKTLLPQVAIYYTSPKYALVPLCFVSLLLHKVSLGIQEMHLPIFFGIALLAVERSCHWPVPVSHPPEIKVAQSEAVCNWTSNTWWRYQMETFSELRALCAGNSPVTGEFPAQRLVTRSFDAFFDPCLNKRLSKQSWCWWF